MTTPAPTLTRHPSLGAMSVVCPKCGEMRFKTAWQVFKDGSKHVRATCAECSAFIRYLPQNQDGKPDFQLTRYEPPPPAPEPQDKGPHPAHRAPPQNWRWLGWIRLDDDVWRPIAEAATAARCWDALAHAPLEGDKLVFPILPTRQAKDGEGLEVAAA